MQRRIRLPDSADLSKIQAKMDNGASFLPVPVAFWHCCSNASLFVILCMLHSTVCMCMHQVSEAVHVRTPLQVMPECSG